MVTVIQSRADVPADYLTGGHHAEYAPTSALGPMLLQVSGLLQSRPQNGRAGRYPRTMIRITPYLRAHNGTDLYSSR